MKIAIFDTQGIGNTIMNTQAIDEICKKGDVIVFTASETQSDLLQHLDCKVQILPKNKILTFLKLIFQKFDLSFYLYPMGYRGWILHRFIWCKKRIEPEMYKMDGHLMTANLKLINCSKKPAYVFPKFDYIRQGIAIHKGSKDVRKIWTGWDDIELEADDFTDPIYDIMTLADKLSYYSLFIGNDSGITHLASACGCKTMTIFTKMSPYDPERCEPVENNISLFDPDIEAVRNKANEILQEQV